MECCGFEGQLRCGDQRERSPRGNCDLEIQPTLLSEPLEFPPLWCGFWSLMLKPLRRRRYLGHAVAPRCPWEAHKKHMADSEKEKGNEATQQQWSQPFIETREGGSCCELLTFQFPDKFPGFLLQGLPGGRGAPSLGRAGLQTKVY